VIRSNPIRDPTHFFRSHLEVFQHFIVYHTKDNSEKTPIQAQKHVDIATGLNTKITFFLQKTFLLLEHLM